MRRAGLGLLGLGGFLAALALAVPLYLLGALASAPEDFYSVTKLRAEGATALDRASGRLLRDQTVEMISTIRGDVNAAISGVAVWDNFTTVRTEGGLTLSYTERRAAFDRRSGRIVNCCGEYVGTSSAVKQSGLAYRWPFFAGRRDYPFFDTVTGTALPMVFQGRPGSGTCGSTATSSGCRRRGRARSPAAWCRRGCSGGPPDGRIGTATSARPCGRRWIARTGWSPSPGRR
nr:hypothetical protein GCM10020093_094550 [Planobispora longispora]